MKKSYEDEEEKREDEFFLLMIEKFAAKYSAVEKVEDAVLSAAQLNQAFNSFAGMTLSDAELSRLISTTTGFSFEWDPLRGEFVWLIKELE